MSFMTKARLFRWVIPCCSLLLVLYCSGFVSKPSDFVSFEEILRRVDEESPSPGETRENLFLPVTTQQSVEAALRAKAETVLRGFGEEDPVAVVTVELNKDWEDVEAVLPQRETRTLSSIQTKGESLDGESDYRNTRSSENYVVGYTKTVTHKTEPRVQRVCCLVQVSEKNAHRIQDVQQAVSVAVGADTRRGDQVLASVR